MKFNNWLFFRNLSRKFMFHYMTRITGALRVDQYAVLYSIYKYFIFLGAFVKLRKATISLVRSVCPSEWNNSAPIRRIFMKYDIWIFLKISRKFMLHYNVTIITVLFLKISIFLYHLAHFFLEWKMFHTNFIEKIKTPISRAISYFRKSFHLWNSVEKCCRTGQTTDDNTEHAHYMLGN